MLYKTIFFLLNTCSARADFIGEYLIKKIDIFFQTLFDSKKYEEQVPGLKRGRKPVYYYVHYKAYGYKNNITPHPLFDTIYYLETYPDASVSKTDPLQHFIDIGSKLRYNPHPLFDTKYYTETYPEAAAPDINPLQHFIETGGYLLYDPSPAFHSKFYQSEYLENSTERIIPVIHFISTGWRLGYNPNELFEVNFYLKNNPDVAAAAINPFIHYMLQGYKEKREPFRDFNYPYFQSFFSIPKTEKHNPIAWYYTQANKPELPKRLKYHQGTKMHDLITKAAAIEPQIGQQYLQGGTINSHYLVDNRFSEIFKKEISTISTKPDYILILPWLSKENSDWKTSLHINYLLKQNYKVLLITTDTTETFTSSFDHNIGKPEILRLGKYKNDLVPYDFLQLLLVFCVHLKPKVIHNNNSALGWNLYKMYGKQLSSRSKIYTSIFGYEYDQNNIKTGYITTYLNDTIEYIHHIFIDNVQLIYDLKNDFGFTQQQLTKFKNIYYLSQSGGGKEYISSIPNPAENVDKKISNKHIIANMKTIFSECGYLI